MKTFLSLISNPLLFAENRLCHKGEAENPTEGQTEALKESMDGRFKVGGKVEGFKYTNDDNTTITEISADGKTLTLKNGETLQKKSLINFRTTDVDGKLVESGQKDEEQWVRKTKTGEMFNEDGYSLEPLDMQRSVTDELDEQEAYDKIDDKAKEAIKKLTEKKDKKIAGLSELNKDKTKSDIESEYNDKVGKINAAAQEEKNKIKRDFYDKKEGITEEAANELAEAFGERVEKIGEEAEEQIEATDFKNRLKNPDDLHEWLTKPENRLTMRKLVFQGRDGASKPEKLITDFKNVQAALKLDDKEYKVIEKNLRIGNLLDDDVIKKITSVKTKGKEMTAKYFYKGGEKAKGVYTEKSKYIPIWDGTEISFGTADLEVVEEKNKEFEKKVTKAKASAPAEGGAKAKGAEPAPGTPAAAAAEGTAGAPQGVPTGSIAVPEATSQDAAKALGQVDQMPTIEGAQEEKVLPKVGAFLKGLIGKGATELSIAMYKNIDNLTKEQLGLAANATDEEVTAAREKTKEQTRAVIDGLLERRVDDQKRGDSYKEFYEVVYGTDFAKVPQNPKVFAKYLDLTGKTILTEGVTGKTDKLTWGEGDVYFKAFIDNTKQSPIDGDISRATELTAEKKDFVKKIYTFAKASTNPVAKIWALELGDWLSENKDPEAQSEKKANFEKLRALVNDKATSPEDRIRFIETIKNTKEDELQAFGVGKEDFEKECKENLAQAYFETQEFENANLIAGDLEDPKQKAFVEAFKAVSTIQSRAQLKGLLETPGVKPESFVKMAERAEKEQFNNPWAACEIYSALQMPEKIKALAEESRTFAGMFYTAMLKENQEERQKGLIEVVTNENFETNPKDFQMTVMEALLKEGISPDLFGALNGLASAQIEEGATADNNAILRAKLMQARLEIAQGQNKETIGGQKLAELGLGENIGSLAYDPKAMIKQTKDYFDNLGANISEADYALLKELHALYHGPTATRKFDENFKDDPESQKTYAGLMYKLYDHTKDKKYLEGIDQSLLSEFGDAKFVESQGDKLYQQALQEADPAKRMNLMSQAANEYLQSALKEKDAKKKLLLSSAYSIALENGDSALVDTIIGEYEKMDDQEAQETVVGIYLQRGDYQAAAELLKKEGTKISLPFTIQKIDEFVAAGYASLAENVCYRRDLYGQLIEQVYRKKKDMDVVLMGWLFSATPDKLSYDTIYGLLKDNDGRKEDSFGGYSFEGYEEAQKKEFCKAKRDTILREPDDTKKRILSKLGFARVEEFESFVSEEVAAEPQPDTTEQPADTTPEKKDHAYTVEENIVKIKTIGGKEYNITLDMPEGFKAKASEGEGDTCVAISDEFGREHIYLELDDEEKVKSDYVAGGDKDKYEMSYSDGTFKVTEKVLPETVGNPEEVGEREADVVDGDIATVEQPQTEQEASIPPETDETEPAAEPTPEAPRKNMYTVNGNVLTIDAANGKVYKITLDMPKGFGTTKTYANEDYDGGFLAIYNENGDRAIGGVRLEADFKEHHWVYPGYEEKYDFSYDEGTSKLTVTEKQPTVQPPEQQKFPTTDEERRKVNEALRQIGEGT